MEKKANILVVDDDPDIGSMLKMMLEYKGYSVTLLRNAGQTEHQLINQATDIVILDMLIAGLNGTDVCRSIRNNPACADVPVLMISALPDARKICIDAGANDFISKPFEMELLLTKVNNIINMNSNRSALPVN
jgi:DNA-binding response OmpR family regulator